jgi:hypothetical protein
MTTNRKCRARRETELSAFVETWRLFPHPMSAQAQELYDLLTSQVENRTVPHAAAWAMARMVRLAWELGRAQARQEADASVDIPH